MHLAIQLLGTPQFQLNHMPITANRRAVVALVAYLAVSETEHPGQRHSRESLAALLWTDYESAKALANLRHTLWEVTHFIGEGWVNTEHETIYPNSKADLTLDVAQFRSLLQQAAQQSEPALRIPLLVEAYELYRDDFLSGFSLKEGASFNEWVSSKATILRHEFDSVLEILVEDYSALNRTPSAIPYAQRLIELDALNESAHRKLMQLYALADQYPAAIKQYQALEKLLRKELNVDPQPETRELYKKLRKGEFKIVSAEKITQSQENAGPKHNLPVQLTSFIGRDKERGEISRLLSQNRLVTLLGAGGIGKTRLAIQMGQQLLGHYMDGVWFIPLESLTDEDVVPRTILSFLKMGELPDQTPVDTLVKELRRKSLVLILDNCEHLLDACAQVVDALLTNCSNVRVLTTSREALRLEGEALYHVPMLTIPKRDHIQALDELAQYEAVRLFLERAKLLVSGFELTDVNLEAVIKICDRLDGIPLAIELAAAHVDIFTFEEILNQLNHSFDLLESNARSVLPRHQTMHASIDWGWNLLTDSERTFMRHLSVFIGGWTLQVARAIGVKDSLERISALWKKSFVVVHQQAGYETRYGFHEVVRSYALEKLVEAGEEETMRDRHLEYFLDLVRQLEPTLDSAHQQQWLERLLVERDNIRAALGWAARTNVQAGLYLSNRLRSFWESYDFREEARWLLMI